MISVVAPVFNEEESVPPLYDRLRAVFEDLGVDWELLLVDDGSVDGTPGIMRDLHERDAHVKGIFFSRNFGQDAALTAGLNAVKGNAVVIMDADLQDPPEMIPAMMKKWKEGYDIVAGRRRRREGESAAKRASAYLWYRIMNLLVRGGFQKDTGDFRLMDRAVVQAFRQYNQYNRFVRSLIASTGFRQIVIDFDRPARGAGETKYTLRRSFGLATTSIMNSSVAPLRLAFWLGVCIMVLSFGAVIHFIRMGLTHRTVPGWASLVVSVWFLGGIQCVLIGIVGEYVGRTYIESQRRPLYIVKESLGLDNDTKDADPAH
jgi:dolichol-phosphate mannosyltransferase